MFPKSSEEGLTGSRPAPEGQAKLVIRAPSGVLPTALTHDVAGPIR